MTVKTSGKMLLQLLLLSAFSMSLLSATSLLQNTTTVALTTSTNGDDARSLGRVLPIVGEVFSAATAGRFAFIVDFTKKMITKVFMNFYKCLGTHDGSEPRCGRLNTVKSCASAAASALGLSPRKAALGRRASQISAAAARAADKQVSTKLSPVVTLRGRKCRSWPSTASST